MSNQRNDLTTFSSRAHHTRQLSISSYHQCRWGTEILFPAPAESEKKVEIRIRDVARWGWFSSPHFMREWHSMLCSFLVIVTIPLRNKIVREELKLLWGIVLGIWGRFLWAMGLDWARSTGGTCLWEWGCNRIIILREILLQNLVFSPHNYETVYQRVPCSKTSCAVRWRRPS